MGIAVIIIVLVIILISIFLMIFLFWKLSKLMRPDVPPNNPLIVSFDTLKTRGFALGVLKEIAGKTSKATRLIMKPLDLPYNHRGKPIMQENVDFAVGDEKKIELPTGALSHHRSIMFLLPESASNLNDEFRNTEFGTAISTLIELRNYKDKAIQIIANRQAGEKSYLALLEEEQNKLVAYFKSQITEITSTAKEKAMIGGIK